MTTIVRRDWCGPWRLVDGRWERRYLLPNTATRQATQQGGDVLVLTWGFATHYGPRVAPHPNTQVRFAA